jgi:hypothetical protein
MLRALLLSSALIAAPAASDASDVHDALIRAITCQAPPLDVVRDLADAGSSRFADGHAGYEIGQEMDTISGVVLGSPLVIGGASTHNVVASLMGMHEGFAAHVHARFSGDHRQAVVELGLEQQEPGGSYVRAMPTTDADDICPLTIELRPLEDGGFLLGCGWCNG